MAEPALGSWLLLGRPGCHLCEEFLEELQAAAPGLPLTQANVDDRDDWRNRYGHSIPVLLDPKGVSVCEVRFDLQRFQKHRSGT